MGLWELILPIIVLEMLRTFQWNTKRWTHEGKKQPLALSIYIFRTVCHYQYIFLVSGSFIIFGSTIIRNSESIIISTIGLKRKSVTLHCSRIWKYRCGPRGLNPQGYGSGAPLTSSKAFRAHTFPLLLISTPKGSNLCVVLATSNKYEFEGNPDTWKLPSSLINL